MARCAGCSSVVHGNSDCILITGDGSVADPMVADIRLDIDPENNIFCGPDGLFVPPPEESGTTIGQKINSTGIAISSRNSASFADLDNTKDTIIPAAVGDLVVVNGKVYLSSENVRVHIDVGSWVSGTSAFTHFGSTADGSFMLQDTLFAIIPFVASKVVVSGDLVSGNLTVRWRYKTATGAKTFGIQPPFFIQNFGPQT